MTTERTIDSAVDAILDDAFVMPVWFVHLALTSGALRMHTDLGTITTLSQNWLGVGDLGSIDGIEESEKSNPYTVRLGLSGIDNDILTAALTEDYYERECTIYLGFRQIITGALLAAPDEMFFGYIDAMQVIDGEESMVVVTVQSEMSDWDQAPLEMYSDAQLQSEYSGDLLLEYLTQMKNLKLVWGRGHRLNTNKIFNPYYDIHVGL